MTTNTRLLPNESLRQLYSIQYSASARNKNFTHDHLQVRFLVWTGHLLEGGENPKEVVPALPPHEGWSKVQGLSNKS
jgi:hypothetical protein